MFGDEHKRPESFARQRLGFGGRAHGARDGIERTSRAGDEMTRAIAKTECEEIHDGRPSFKSIAPGAIAPVAVAAPATAHSTSTIASVSLGRQRHSNSAKSSGETSRPSAH